MNFFNTALLKFFDQTDRDKFAPRIPTERIKWAPLVTREVPITGQKVAKKKYADGRQKSQQWRKRARLNYVAKVKRAKVVRP